MFADNAIYEGRNLLGFSNLDWWGYRGISSPCARGAGTAGVLCLIHGPKLSKLYEPPQKNLRVKLGELKSWILLNFSSFCAGEIHRAQCKECKRTQKCQGQNAMDDFQYHWLPTPGQKSWLAQGCSLQPPPLVNKGPFISGVSCSEESYLRP